MNFYWQEQCPERQRLMRNYTDAVRAHHEITKIFAAIQSNYFSTDVLRSDQRSRVAADVARLLFDSHIADHECE